LPRLAHQALAHSAAGPQQEQTVLLKHLIAEQKRTNLLLGLALYFGAGIAIGVVVVQVLMRWHHLGG
jgi:ubiquinone biosynthesis protein